MVADFVPVGEWGVSNHEGSSRHAAISRLIGREAHCNLPAIGPASIQRESFEGAVYDMRKGA